MEQSKVAVKSKASKKIIAKKDMVTSVEEAVATPVIKSHGLNLTLDNSLDRFDNDPFFVEKTRIANEKFKSNPSGV